MTQDKFKLLIIRVNRDEDFIERLSDEVMAANIEVEALVNSLMKKAA